MSSPVIRNGSLLLLAKKSWLQPCLSRASHKAEKLLPVFQPRFPSVLTLGTGKSFHLQHSPESLSMKCLKNLISWTKRRSSFLWPSSPGWCQLTTRLSSTRICDPVDQWHWSMSFISKTTNSKATGPDFRAAQPMGPRKDLLHILYYLEVRIPVPKTNCSLQVPSHR